MCVQEECRCHCACDNFVAVCVCFRRVADARREGERRARDAEQRLNDTVNEYELKLHSLQNQLSLLEDELEIQSRSNKRKFSPCCVLYTRMISSVCCRKYICSCDWITVTEVHVVRWFLFTKLNAEDDLYAMLDNYHHYTV